MSKPGGNKRDSKMMDGASIKNFFSMSKSRSNSFDTSDLRKHGVKLQVPTPSIDVPTESRADHKKLAPLSPPRSQDVSEFINLKLK
jgi:hypothetical protein